jgi:diguanylate cyclase (GGDEF)-like protein
MTRNTQGIEEISAVAAIPSMGWFVISSVPTSIALAAVDQTKSYLLWHLILLLAIGLPAIGGFVTWVLRPLFLAADRAKKMANGEMPLEPLPVARDDEVGHLTTAFNQLLDKLAQSQAELHHMAYHDTLTGLPNRSLLVDRLEQALARGNRNGSRLAVLFMDLDGFKSINDTLGHEAGDDVLRETARRLSSVVRRVDTLARIGGDEFVLLAVDLTNDPDQGVDRIANKCIEVVMAPLQVQGMDYHMGISVGVALCCGGCTAERILAEADKAMYEAKQKGNGRYQMAPSCDERMAAEQR